MQKKIFIINSELVAYSLFKSIFNCHFPIAVTRYFMNGRDAWPIICQSVEGGEDVSVVTCTEYNDANMDGFDLVRLVKSLEGRVERRIPVAMTSGYGATIAREVKESGADIFITTPSDFSVLKDKLQELLATSF